MHGTIHDTGQGYWAFKPAPLPLEFDINDKAAQAIDEALDELAKARNGQQRTSDEAALDEAIASSAIEGINVSKETVLDNGASTNLDAAVVIDLANLLGGLVDPGPLTHDEIWSMHEALFWRFRGAGEYRTGQVHIRGEQDGIEHAQFIPPLAQDVPELMDNLIDYINEVPADPRDTFVRAFMAHYQFETIRPFESGNGRIGRVLLLRQLIYYGQLPDVVIAPSILLHQNKDAYFEYLSLLRGGDRYINHWLQFMAKMVFWASR